MATLIVMCGPAGSGKSTWASNYRMDHPEFSYVSTDQIRGELWGDEGLQDNPGRVFEVAFYRLKKALRHGEDVIFDATNLTRRDRREVLWQIRGIDCVKMCVVMKATPNECIERQDMRARHVPAAVIERQFHKWQMPTEDEGWNKIFFEK